MYAKPIVTIASAMILALACLDRPLQAQSVDSELSDARIEAIHNELRALKKKAEAAFNALGESGNESDLETLLDNVHDDAVLIGMNGRIVVGKDGIRDEFVRTLGGPQPTLESIHHTFDVAALSTLYEDDTAIAYGTSAGTYDLAGGMHFEVDTYWTATMVRENGDWLLASFQFAPSIFDNPVLDKAVNTIYLVAAIAVLAGFIAGFLLATILSKKRASA